MANSKAKFSVNERLNDATYNFYFNRLCNIAMAVYEWKNLPDSVDPRFLEKTIFTKGMCLLFEDEVMGLLALPCTIGGKLDVYDIPTMRTAKANNGYIANRSTDDSVIAYHDYTHSIPIWDVQMFAERLTNLQRTVDINVHAQKTPVIVVCPEEQRLTYENIMLQYEANTPLIIGNKKLDTKNNIYTLNTEAPFVADKIEELRVQVWNDAMTYFGISNVNVTKKERLITDEVQRNMGGTLASRYSPLDMRRTAAEKVNKMFGTNIEVNFREDILAYQSQIIGETEEMIKNGEIGGDKSE